MGHFYKANTTTLLLLDFVAQSSDDLKSSTDLHEVVCDVLWLQACDSLGGGRRYIDSEVSGLQSAEVCEQVRGLLVQGGGGTRQDLERKITGKICAQYI